jgi:hypothetical protein
MRLLAATKNGRLILEICMMGPLMVTAWDMPVHAKSQLELFAHVAAEFELCFLATVAQ